MKSLVLNLLVFGTFALSSCRNAIAPPPDPDIVRQQQKRVVELESQLDGLRHTNNRWQTVCALIGVGAVGLLIFGTALGAKTRNDALATP
jgi:hypothetical protein